MNDTISKEQKLNKIKEIGVYIQKYHDKFGISDDSSYYYIFIVKSEELAIDLGYEFALLKERASREEK